MKKPVVKYQHHPMQHPKGMRHPSGRPIRSPHVVGRPVWRIPDDGPNCPKLQKRHDTYAIGFVHDFGYDDE